MEAEKQKKKARIVFLKYMIIVIPALLLTGLVTGIVILSVSNHRLRNENERLTENLEEVLGKAADYDEISGVYSVQGVDVISHKPNSSDTPGQNAYEGKKQIYLTFDDGPSAYTDEILDILNKYDVKATFFVVAKKDEKSIEAYKRIAEEGHTLAMHSYSHKYTEIYKSVESFREDLSKLQEFIYETTGVWSRIYRFPGGSSNTISKLPMQNFIDCLEEEGICYFDWNVSAQDAVSGGMLSTENIISNCIRPIDRFDECVVLMHDSQDRRTTVDALEGIIQAIIKRGDCVILPITDDTATVQHVTRQIK